MQFAAIGFVQLCPDDDELIRHDGFSVFHVQGGSNPDLAGDIHQCLQRVHQAVSKLYISGLGIRQSFQRTHVPS